jgi:hypothetical protein
LSRPNVTVVLNARDLIRGTSWQYGHYLTGTKESFMSDAYIIETPLMTAGIVAAQEKGFRFYASHPAMFPLEGKVFESVKAAQRAADILAATFRTPPADAGKAAKWGYPRANIEKLGSAWGEAA